MARTILELGPVGVGVSIPTHSFDGRWDSSLTFTLLLFDGFFLDFIVTSGGHTDELTPVVMMVVMATVMVCRLNQANVFIAVSRPHHDGQGARVQVVGLMAVVGSSRGRASSAMSTNNRNRPTSAFGRFNTAAVGMVVMVMARTRPVSYW